MTTEPTPLRGLQPEEPTWFPEWARIALLDAYVILLLYLTGLPRLKLPEQLSGRDLQLHFLAYMILSGLTLWVLAGWELRPPTPALLVRYAIESFAFCLGFGAFDEWRQGFVPGRFTSVSDWKADAAGAAFGASLVLVLLLIADGRKRKQGVAAPR